MKRFELVHPVEFQHDLYPGAFVTLESLSRETPAVRPLGQLRVPDLRIRPGTTPARGAAAEHTRGRAGWLRGRHSVGVMAQHSGPPDEASSTSQLAAMAARLRDAATRAGRLDVAAKADEALTLLAGAETPKGDDPEQRRRDTGNAILRTLDGLGF
jgi:hypothetical protein